MGTLQTTDPLSQLRTCIGCGTQLAGKQRKYCSRNCTDNYRYKHNPTRKAAAATRRDETRQLLNAYKMDRGCCVCGYKEHPAALECNHINPYSKRFTVGASVSMSWPALEEELKKCEIMCANCHAIHTTQHGHTKIRK